jgi:diguanylate cyclase (GGDEF)-like protein
MNLRTKILAIMAIPFVVLAVSTAAILYSRARTSQALASERHASAVLEQLHQVQSDLVDMEDGMRGYVLTEHSDLLVPFNDALANLSHDLDRLRSLVAEEPSQVARIDHLEQVANVRIVLLQEMSAFAPVTSLTNRSQFATVVEQGKQAMDDIRATIAQIEASEERLLAEHSRGLDASRRLSFLIAIVAMPLALLASLAVVWLFTQGLVRRIRGAQENARRVEDGIPPDEPSAADDELGHLERALARTGTKVIELQEELRRIGMIDPLTRLTNRRGFIPTAEHQLQHARRTQEPMALMFCDLDGLKIVNDTLGHATGDAMIAEAAYVLRSTFRASDLVARMGGDEFCVLFAADSAAAAEATVARLDAAIAELNAQEDRPFVLGVSLGVALFDPERPSTLDELMADADRLMYACKRSRASARVGRGALT